MRRVWVCLALLGSACVPDQCYDDEDAYGRQEAVPSPATALAPGEARWVRIRASARENPSGIAVEPHVTLVVEVKEGEVCDWMNPSGPEGRPSGNNPLLHLSEGQRVEPHADWMEVVARVDGQDTLVGRGPSTVASATGGELILLVNDVKTAYGNNRGGFLARVSRP